MRSRRRRGPRHVAVDWRGLADGRLHVLRRGVDFAHPLHAMADLAKVAAGRLGMTAVVMADNLGSYELIWVQFAELETVADAPCPACGSVLVARTRVLARCSGCGKLVVVRARRERASPEAVALLDKALGRGRAPEPVTEALGRAASAEKPPRSEAKLPKAERRRKGERAPKAERPLRVERVPKGERTRRGQRLPTSERLQRLDQKSVRGELGDRYGRRLDDFEELELFFDEDESEATVERFYGHGIDPTGNVSIIRVDFPLDESGQRLPDVRNEGDHVYKLLVMPLSTFERLGEARFDTDEDVDDDEL